MEYKENGYTVRPTLHEEVPAVMEIIDLAKADMRASGSDQWQNGTPNAELIHSDIDAEKSYVLVDETGTIQGTACIIADIEPAYNVIRDGSWRSEEPYTVIHRVAVRRSERGRGLAGYLVRFAIAYSKEKGVNHLRIDTHPINTPMRHFLTRNGFSQRGFVDLPDGLRIAYDYLIEDHN